MYIFEFITFFFVFNEIILPINSQSIQIDGIDVTSFSNNIVGVLNITSIENINLDSIDINDIPAVAKAVKDAGEWQDKAMLFFLLKQDIKELDKIDEKLKKIDKEYKKLTGTPLIADDYSPHNNNCIEDIIFALIRDANTVKIGYFTSLLLDNQSYKYGPLLMQMLIIEDTNRRAIIDEYNKVSLLNFVESIELFHEDDYKNFLLELANKTPEPDVENVNQQEVEKKLKKLNSERKDGSGWEDDRDELDEILMMKPKKFASELIKKYYEWNGNKLRDDIQKKLEEPNLIFGYQNLIDYKLDSYGYMATRIYDTMDDHRDFRATYILLVVLNRNSPELVKINEAFTTLYKMSLTAYLMDPDQKHSCYNDVVCQTINYLIMVKLQAQT